MASPVSEYNYEIQAILEDYLINSEKEEFLGIANSNMFSPSIAGI